MKRIITALALLTLAVTGIQAQNMGVQKRNPNDPLSIDIDPIDKLAPSKLGQNDSIAVMTAEEVAVTADKRDVRRARKLLEEQIKVGELTRELIEQVKFQFEPYYCRYKTEYRSEGFLGKIRCYGGTFVTSLDIIPLNNQQYRRANEHYFGNGSALLDEKSYTDFNIEDIHQDPENEDQLLFDIVVNAPIIVDGRTEMNLRYNFVLNYKNGKMGCTITGSSRKYASYYGYVTDLR